MKFFFKQMLKVSAFYLEKQKSLIPKKNIIQAVISNQAKRREFQQMALCCPNFPGRFWRVVLHIYTKIEKQRNLVLCRDHPQKALARLSNFLTAPSPMQAGFFFTFVRCQILLKFDRFPLNYQHFLYMARQPILNGWLKRIE